MYQFETYYDVPLPLVHEDVIAAVIAAAESTGAIADKLSIISTANGPKDGHGVPYRRCFKRITFKFPADTPDSISYLLMRAIEMGVSIGRVLAACDGRVPCKSPES